MDSSSLTHTNKFMPKYGKQGYINKKKPGTAVKKPVKYQVDLRSEKSSSVLSNKLVTKSFDSSIKKKTYGTNLHKKSPAKMNISYTDLLSQSQMNEVNNFNSPDKSFKRQSLIQ
jgi:hypothetical protein